MDNRFSSLFNITEERAIALLQTPLEELEDQSDRYAAAAHLAYFKSARSINALIDAIENCDEQLCNRIARRKAIETLGKFKAIEGLDVISNCLNDPDCYTIENSVWSIGEIGTQDEQILETITKLLKKPNQNYRVIIQTLAKLNYQPAVDSMQPFVKDTDQSIASSAISAIARLTDDYSQVEQIVTLLESDSVNDRRACIQDLMDLKYYQAIPQIASCPVSLVFRLRAIRHLATIAIEKEAKTFSEIEPYLDQVILDHPDTLEFVHEYDQLPNLEFLLNELFHTDFGRCYLGSKTLLDNYADVLPEELITLYDKSARNDYGANYHVMKLFGWLEYQPAQDLLIQALNNKAPQFQKSRGAAAIALANLKNTEVADLLQKNLQTNIFDLQYACLLALQKLGIEVEDGNLENADLLIKAKASSIN